MGCGFCELGAIRLAMMDRNLPKVRKSGGEMSANRDAGSRLWEGA